MILIADKSQIFDTINFDMWLDSLVLIPLIGFSIALFIFVIMLLITGSLAYFTRNKVDIPQQMIIKIVVGIGVIITIFLAYSSVISPASKLKNRINNDLYKEKMCVGRLVIKENKSSFEAVKIILECDNENFDIGFLKQSELQKYVQSLKSDANSVIKTTVFTSGNTNIVEILGRFKITYYPRDMFSNTSPIVRTFQIIETRNHVERKDNDLEYGQKDLSSQKHNQRSNREKVKNYQTISSSSIFKDWWIKNPSERLKQYYDGIAWKSDAFKLTILIVGSVLLFMIIRDMWKKDASALLENLSVMLADGL